MNISSVEEEMILEAGEYGTALIVYCLGLVDMIEPSLVACTDTQIASAFSTSIFVDDNRRRLEGLSSKSPKVCASSRAFDL